MKRMTANQMNNALDEIRMFMPITQKEEKAMRHFHQMVRWSCAAQGFAYNEETMRVTDDGGVHRGSQEGRVIF